MSRRAGHAARGLERIVSGGQSGVDRAALDAALALGVPCGGWCPKGRLAEDGPIDPRYPLRETRSPRYERRTYANVRDSDATLIVARGELTGGTAYTARVARELGRPVLVVAPQPSQVPRVVAWLAEERVGVLNVAGPRESGAPGIYADARRFLEDVLRAAPRA
ncbi:MAG: putative molybdenum carrier protein [Thermodesulfobacteriota bacterium]